jgi:hypothetical protein
LEIVFDNSLFSLLQNLRIWYCRNLGSRGALLASAKPLNVETTALKKLNCFEDSGGRLWGGRRIAGGGRAVRNRCLRALL